MKIAWVSHSGGSLGAERVLMEGVRELIAAGHACAVALPATGEQAPAWADLGADVARLPLPWWMRGPGRYTLKGRLGASWKTGRALWPVRRWLRRVQPDVVITNTLTMPVAAIAAHSLGLAHIWYIHEFGDLDHRLHFALGKATSLRMVRALSQRVIVNSRAVREHFAGSLDADRTRLLYCATDIDTRVTVARDLPPPWTLVMVGGLSPQKGHGDALHAVALLRQQGVDVRLRIVGPSSGDYLAVLEALAHQLGVAPHVDFAGSTPDPSADYARAAIALTCAPHEAFGRVTVEAMTMGTTVVGARGGGTAELIRDGDNGLLYEPGDPADLAAKVGRLIANPALRLAMGERARRWAGDRFRRDRFGQELIAIIQQAVGARVPKRQAWNGRA